MIMVSLVTVIIGKIGVCSVFFLCLYFCGYGSDGLFPLKRSIHSLCLLSSLFILIVLYSSIERKISIALLTVA